MEHLIGDCHTQLSTGEHTDVDLLLPTICRKIALYMLWCLSESRILKTGVTRHDKPKSSVV